MRPQTQLPKILVVDDEIDHLELLYRTFYLTYRVLQAQSGMEALDILEREQDIAVIISDQKMPRMSGTEFLRRAAAQYPDIMRILLTGYTDVENLVEAINSGQVFKYVTKPWNLESIQEIVRQAVETHNVLKVRTKELGRNLRRQSLLNTVTNTIRNAQYWQSEESPLREVLQTIVNALGQVLEVDACILRPFEDGRLAREYFLYQKLPPRDRDCLSPDWEHTVWEIAEVEVLDDIAEGDRAPEGVVPALKAVGIASTLAVPLKFQTQRTAVLALHRCGAPHPWEDDEVQLAVMVADQAALAISQARAYEQVQALAQRESLVNTVTQAIRSSLEPQEIFSAITEQLGSSLNVDGCALSLWTEQDEFVRCVAVYNRDAPPVLPVLPSQVPITSNPVLQQLLRARSPVVLSDLEAESEMKGGDLPLRSPPARALLVVPLLVERQIIGSISLRQTREPRRWSTADVELATAVASQAAIAVKQSRLYQKTRQQAERLLELDRQKTEFFQNISHELRTPLTLNLGPLESSVAREQGLSLDQTQMALRNSRRLLRLVNQLLDLQRLDAGRMQATFRPCNLAYFIEQIVATFRPYCERKGLDLQTHLSPCGPIYLDLEKFDKVLYNLLSNAMKFTHPGGCITVTLESAGDYVRLQVKDTGIGIARSQVPHLFERFRQAEGSLARSYEGTGLGLALVKEMVDLHGGQVTVESVEQEEQGRDRGTTFSVWLLTGTAHLPLEQILEIPSALQVDRAAVELADLEAELLDLDSENPQTTADVPSAISLSRSLVLVIEDNPDLRAYVRYILLGADYEVCTARNGEEGWQLVQGRSPQLIVTDLMMPQVSGLDLIHRVRNHPDFKGTPIILLTAKADEESRILGAERGADAYLAKPFNDRELLAEVRNLLALKENERRVRRLNEYLTESVLARFLPPEMVKRASLGNLKLDFQPDLRLVTILFCDIVGFTPLSNTLRSRCVAQLLNEYLATMTEAIFSVGGVVDKFIGDAIVALFGAPEELSPNEQVRRAIAAARKMSEALDGLNGRWQEAGLLGGECRPPLLQFRCGIHQGATVVGMFGSQQRADYTAIGPTVNIASRLQQAAQPGTVVLSSAVADYLENDEIVKYEPLKLKGVDETILTFLLQEMRSRAVS
ncbi:MAG: response regulator [Cyanobacteriota bacterium]|nr:response regulator [Cyanobacteriota bacterium]